MKGRGREREIKKEGWMENGEGERGGKKKKRNERERQSGGMEKGGVGDGGNILGREREEE